MGEIAGRNASEPRGSLVNELEEPTLWSRGEGRSARAETTEVVRVASRGSRGGMLRKLSSAVLETRYGGGEAINGCV